jgi:hypothetical protein
MPTNYIKTDDPTTPWKPISQFWLKVEGYWKSVSQGWIKVEGYWKQFFGSDSTYTFSLGNTVHIGTNGYISLDSGQTVDSVSSTVDRVLGILPADLELNSIRYAADSSKFYVFFRGKRFGGTNFEIEYEVHFTNGQDYALIKLVAFPTSTYSLTGYYVDGSSTGYSRITATRTVGAEYRVYFNTTTATTNAFTEFGSESHPVWLSQSTLTSGTADQGYISIVASQGSSPQAPTSVTASSITGTTATVSWSAITNANAGMSAIQSYDYSINGGSSWTSTSSSTSVNLTGLSAGGTSYTVLVRANNYYFTGVNYGTVTFSTLSNLTAPTITSVTSGVAGGPVSVFFTGGSGPAYQMYWTTGVAPSTPGFTPDASGSSSPLTDNTGPGSSGFTWYAYVRSVATVGETSIGPSTVASDWSAGFAFTVTAPPPTITNVTASSITTATATISWSSTNQATYSIAGLPGSPLTGTTATSRAVTGLSPSTTYTATVTLANSAGATTAASVIFTTTANPNISSITLTPGGSSTGVKMTATWSATNTASVFFMVYRSSSSAVNSPVNTFVTSGTTNGSTITTSQPTTGINFYYQFYLTPYSGSSGTGSAGTQRVTGVKRNTASGGPTTYNF